MLFSLKANRRSDMNEKSNSSQPNADQLPSSSNLSSSNSSSSTARVNIKFRLPKRLQWIPQNWTWPKIKPVIRCAVVAWVSAVLFIIPKVEFIFGQASFMILIAAFLSPPSDPFLAVFEREILILLFVTLAWAWASLGIFLANLARSNVDPTISLLQAVSGEYIEVSPTVIMAVFLFVGSAFFLYIKARQGPGPYFFPTIFACICLDISLTTAVLFPYPYYLVGKSIVIPLCFHSALALLGSLLIFPSTMTAEFTARLRLILTPMIATIESNQQIFDTSLSSEEFRSLSSSINSQVKNAEGGLVLTAATGRLLSSDFIFSRFAPEDFRIFQNLVRRLTGRAGGMSLYFTLVDRSNDRFLATPMPSMINTPRPSSPVISRPHSPERALHDQTHVESESDLVERNSVGQQEEPSSPISAQVKRGVAKSCPTSRRSSQSDLKARPLQSHHHHHHPHHHHHSLHNTLLHLTLGRKKEQAVGIFESQRYMNLEATRWHDPYVEIYTERLYRLLQECCMDLLGAVKEGLVGVQGWLGGVRDSRIKFWIRTKEQDIRRQEILDEVQQLRYRVARALEEFRTDKRLKVLDPYRPAFEKQDDNPDSILPPHRYLFECYVYEYHLIQFSSIVVEMLDEIIELEVKRTHVRFWTPVRKYLTWSKYDIPDNVQNEEDDDPDIVQGIQPVVLEDLGLPVRRDPDALPPRNAFEWVMNILYHAASGLMHGNALFAIKAGLFTVVLCLPSFLESSASFAYKNRFVWAIIMGQLTLARFRGDTTFGLTARIVSTFGGGVVGMVMWYISCGNGKGNPYGLAVVFAVCFPIFYFVVLYWPIPPMTKVVFFVTTILVVGYSYQDVQIILPGSPGFGFSVAWRRFVLVTIGVAAAFVISFLPPATTIRRYQRRLLSTTCTELGTIYCSIVSFANTRRESEVQEILSSLVAIQGKLRRSLVLRENVIYEFSLRGRWPAERYQKVLELQLQIACSLSHLVSVIRHLEPAWTKAFLKRTRLVDPDFQGDTLAVFTMIASSLRTGDPLPQITPCPLIDRFMLKYHGFNIVHEDSEEDYGLPRSLTLETLGNEQYLTFCVGVATTYNIMKRLDRLMIAAKDVVGEQYHIHGVGIASTLRSTGVELGPRTSTVHFRGSGNV